MWAAYKELIPTILKQQKESDYHVPPVLPQLKSSKLMKTVEKESIECPAHQGRFNIKSGEATHSPACDKLKIYHTRIIDSVVYICFTGKNK